jgi:hypothetical protein
VPVPLHLPTVVPAEDMTTATLTNTNSNSNNPREVAAEDAEVTVAMEEAMEVITWEEAAELQLHGRACMMMSPNQTTAQAALVEALILNMHHRPTHRPVPRTPVNRAPTTEVADEVADEVETADFTPTRDRLQEGVGSQDWSRQGWRILDTVRVASRLSDILSHVYHGGMASHSHYTLFVPRLI